VGQNGKFAMEIYKKSYPIKKSCNIALILIN